ncbi:hypothetical protein PG989_003584 [Apiospora arundinis]
MVTEHKLPLTVPNAAVITLAIVILDLGLRVRIILLLLLSLLGFGGLGVTHLDILVLVLVLVLLVFIGGWRAPRDLDAGGAAEIEVAGARPAAALLSAAEGVAALAPLGQLLLVALLELVLLRLGQVLPAARQLLLEAELAGRDLVLVLSLQDGPHVVAIYLERVARALGGAWERKHGGGRVRW